MIKYLGGGEHEFNLENGETIILTDRDLINLRVDMQAQAKNTSTPMYDIMQIARAENPSSKHRKKKGRR